MTAARLCLNCTHIFTAGESAQRFPLCAHPAHGVSLVTGAPLRPACETLRQAGKACGTPGFLFQAAASHEAASAATPTTAPTTEALRAALAQHQPPAPGAWWPEKYGWYGGMVCAPDGSRATLMVLPKGPQCLLDPAPWGEYGQDVPGAASPFDGRANTAAMAQAGSQIAKDVLAMGCHIPSQLEALVLRTTLQGHVPKGIYWTSTQDSPLRAVAQSFEGGFSGWSSKGSKFRVLALRGLTLQPFSTFKAGAA